MVHLDNISYNKTNQMH